MMMIREKTMKNHRVHLKVSVVIFPAAATTKAQTSAGHGFMQTPLWVSVLPKSAV